jgi:hypothetical protein
LEKKKKEVKMFKLQKFGSFGQCIAKIETLEVKLKITSNFGGIKYNFSLYDIHGRIKLEEF